MSPTIEVDDDILKRARIRAARENTFCQRGDSGVLDGICRGESTPSGSL